MGTSDPLEGEHLEEGEIHTYEVPPDDVGARLDCWLHLKWQERRLVFNCHRMLYTVKKAVSTQKTDLARTGNTGARTRAWTHLIALGFTNYAPRPSAIGQVIAKINGCSHVTKLKRWWRNMI